MERVKFRWWRIPVGWRLGFIYMGKEFSVRRAYPKEAFVSEWSMLKPNQPFKFLKGGRLDSWGGWHETEYPVETVSVGVIVKAIKEQKWKLISPLSKMEGGYIKIDYPEEGK